MDRSVQQTDFDALSYKMAAISKGYLPSVQQTATCCYKNYKETHLEYCNTLKKLNRRAYSRVHNACRSLLPVMNYGTYLRTESVDVELHKFLERYGERAQVVNLGCGSDLRMLMIMDAFENVRYVDIDFQASVKLKKDVLIINERLKQQIKVGDGFSEDRIVTDRYVLVPGDLRNGAEICSLLKEFTSRDVPTIIITECVLCYLSDDSSKNIIDVVISFYEHGEWISYDPIGGADNNDRFGIIMQANLRESRRLEMPTLMMYNSKETYASRFPYNSSIKTMWEYYESDISSKEKQRLKTLQFLDELEELEILLSHYIILITSW
ncbi:leucine carboxy methyltransferase Ecym_4082 [Eremothecium cymbalariae DBVPG|uniref:Leucine carboxyl methyltransferase 1 n=1 Tax=Eremothecium cymbalariae (strain CBS 270.75 / DBVPG 7215 / KCTC 17166 / NRRL Y-17582) TaxID=931890 RepID=G8JT08_ERECY|nr:hypothetical protein Ecym_4082 [Eremothecium cymbalariae DBVPG\